MIRFSGDDSSLWGREAGLGWGLNSRSEPMSRMGSGTEGGGLLLLHRLSFLAGESSSGFSCLVRHADG